MNMIDKWRCVFDEGEFIFMFLLMDFLISYNFAEDDENPLGYCCQSEIAAASESDDKAEPSTEAAVSTDDEDATDMTEGRSSDETNSRDSKILDSVFFANGGKNCKIANFVLFN